MAAKPAKQSTVLLNCATRQILPVCARVLRACVGLVLVRRQHGGTRVDGKNTEFVARGLACLVPKYDKRKRRWARQRLPVTVLLFLNA
jgi:hypothetical protein